MFYYPQAYATLSVIFDGFGGGDSKPLIIDIIPKEARVCLNSYKEADTFDLTIDAKNFPISPDLIRGAAVKIFMGDLESLTLSPKLVASPDNLKIAGLVDDATLSGDKDGATLTVTGRDYTALLMEKTWDPKRRVPLGQPLDELVQELVDEATQKDVKGRTLNVIWNGDVDPPIVGGTVTTHKTKKRGFTPAQGGKNYWDVIYNLCIRHGFIVFVNGFDVWISRPNVLSWQARSSVAKVVYGQNLLTVEVERKLGKETVPQITVRSYDPETKEAIAGVWPSNADIAARGMQAAKTGIGTQKDQTKSFTVPGVTDVATLNRIAENAYNTIARGESLIRFSTKHLKDLQGKDLLRLRAGAAVSIGFQMLSDDAGLASMTPYERYRILTAAGIKPVVAGVIAENYPKLDYFRRPFYCREVTINWSHTEGLQIEAEAVNFVSTQRDTFEGAGDFPVPANSGPSFA